MPTSEERAQAAFDAWCARLEAALALNKAAFEQSVERYRAIQRARFTPSGSAKGTQP